ncbi:DUF4064 domain-containing protein [Paenibacillus azoreducens]|uniref:DUF4064 domain-containing protein n=1 Tax=Paenibacillus azoreducens TaxID=116718 RepID=A0A920CSE1_9BACL|nr:DUF4064 domain-containing protein [Paenibacillus azoreducens]GIO49195.1 hypothetical protein J34TS1_39600 [Paenibacillus azoreducens]
MKRTGEIILSIIGAVTSLIMVGTGIFFLYSKDNQTYLDYLHANWNDTQVAATLEQMNQAGTLWVLPGIAGIVLSILAIFLLKGNANPKIVGWMLILGSVVLCIISVFGFFPLVFFVIAGIMALVRNPNVRRKQGIR